MAINATFQADFTNFLSGVEKAERALGGFEQGASKADKSVSQLSTAWGAFQGVLGAFGLQASIGAVISFGKEILADADALEKLADQTGISVEQLQFLQQAGQDAGVSLDAMTGAVSTLQAKVGQGDTGAIGALTSLGITVADFKAMDEPFHDIAQAISEIEDPIEQARVASELFGTRWKDLAPLLKKGMEDARDSASIMSRDTVAFFGAMGDAADGFWTRLKAKAAEAAHEGWLGISFGTATAQAKVFQDTVNDIKLPGIFMEGLAKPGLPADLDAINKSLDDGLKTAKDSTAAWQTWKDAVDKVNIATGYFQTIIDTIPGDVLEAMKAMHEQGAAAKDLGDMFGLTNIQVEAFNALQKDAAAKTDFASAALARQKEIQALMLKATNDRVVAQLKASQDLQAASEAELAAALKAEEWWSKKTETTKKDTKAVEDATKATGVYMNQLHMLVDDPKLAAFFGGNPVATTLYSGGHGGLTPEEAASMAAGIFINAAVGGEKFWGTSGRWGGGGYPGRAAGGPVSAGRPYMVGEQGPELFVPSQSGRIAANGGGVTVVNTFHVNGTAQDVARQIADVLNRQVMQGRKLSGS